MPTATDPFPDFIPGTPAEADKVDARFAALFSVINNIDTANLATGGVAVTDLAAAVLQQFFQLMVPGTHKVAFGRFVESVGWGGTNIVANRTIPHGLGVTPAVVIMTAEPLASQSAGGLPIPVVVSVQGRDATNITYEARLSDGGNSNLGTSYHWLAIT